jgi:hypothetical protein
LISHQEIPYYTKQITSQLETTYLLLNCLTPDITNIYLFFHKTTKQNSKFEEQILKSLLLINSHEVFWTLIYHQKIVVDQRSNALDGLSRISEKRCRQWALPPSPSRRNHLCVPTLVSPNDRPCLLAAPGSPAPARFIAGVLGASPPSFSSPPLPSRSPTTISLDLQHGS